MNDSTRLAPDGFTWVCGACGKTSKDRYGDSNSRWDESCFLNSFLAQESSLEYFEGRVISIKNNKEEL